MGNRIQLGPCNYTEALAMDQFVSRNFFSSCLFFKKANNPSSVVSTEKPETAPRAIAKNSIGRTDRRKG
jgi:hypothetical protein